MMKIVFILLGLAAVLGISAGRGVRVWNEDDASGHLVDPVSRQKCQKYQPNLE